ncbi:hypothetical protein CAPTEDRAFT_207100 [Capitella teleta]|uniref:Major facilitator superfamily (MFS) profile domain-containing protein n=1 Tax=Capitella teleta TaxID=283909 RepID=R7TED9_CAPTE|nr:hypothetical protein CAPTEDRAFT_207100 [Capitella teleta]|eukprot:ELT89426.1 hypothetical protein CAPTEDRAFT_207100 [Capitella teleta]
MDSSCELDVPIREGPQRLLACSDFVEIEQEDSDRSSPSSDSSSGSVEGACQTCLSVCQADCCQLLLRYKSWKSPAIVEGVMFVLIFAYGCMYHVTVQYTYEHIWQAANSAMTNTTLPHAGNHQVMQTRDSYWYSCQYLQRSINATNDMLAVTTFKVLNQTSEWEQLLSFARSFPPVFVSLTVVSYTDVIGRRFGLIVPAIGSLCAVVVSHIIQHHSLPLKYMIIASIINGAFGSFTCATGSAYVYILDTVPTEQRTFRFSLFASLRFAALGLAFMLSSYFVEYIHFGGTFVVIMLLFIATLVYIIFVLPESSAIGKMRTIRDFNPIALFISSMLPFEVFARERPNRQHQYILLLLLVTNFFESAISFGSFQVLSRLVVAPPFCSHPDTVTLLQMFVLVLAVAGPFIAIQLFSERLPDAGIGTVASLLTTIGLAIQALSSNYVTLVIGLLFQRFVPIPNGVSRSIMST